MAATLFKLGEYAAQFEEQRRILSRFTPSEWEEFFFSQLVKSAGFHRGEYACGTLDAEEAALVAFSREVKAYRRKLASYSDPCEKAAFTVLHAKGVTRPHLRNFALEGRRYLRAGITGMDEVLESVPSEEEDLVSRETFRQIMETLSPEEAEYVALLCDQVAGNNPRNKKATHTYAAYREVFGKDGSGSTRRKFHAKIAAQVIDSGICSER